MLTLIPTLKNEDMAGNKIKCLKLINLWYMVIGVSIEYGIFRLVILKY